MTSDAPQIRGPAYLLGWVPVQQRSTSCCAAPGTRVRSCRVSHLFGETGAERMRRIDPEDLELLGEERQLLERERERAVVRMAFDVGIELRGEEIALDHIALELGHVDAVGGETAERLVERGRHVAHPEQER